MAFKRKGDEPPPAPKGGDVKIIDELVKKSLAVNPAMRRGRDTVEILERLRAEAVGIVPEDTGDFDPPSTALPVPKRKHQDPRLQTLFIFMSQKAGDLPQVFNTLSEQRKALEDDYRRKLSQVEAQENATRREILAEAVDMVRVLMATGAKPLDCQQALSDFREVLKLLNTSEGEIVRLAQSKPG